MKRFFAALTITLLLPQASFAEMALSLKEAVAAGLKGNPEIRAFENSTAASREDVGIARSQLLPKITFEERFMRTNNPTFAFMAKLNQERFTPEDFAISSLNDPDSINDFQTSLSFEQPVYVRKAQIGLKMAKEEYSAKKEDLERKKEEAAFSIARTYLMVNTAAGFVTVSEQAVKDAKEHLRLAASRHDSGLGLYSDVLRGRTRLIEAEQKLVSARKNLSVGKRALGLLIGLSEGVSAEGGPVDLALRDIDHYLAAASARSDLRSFSKRRDNAKNNVALAGSDYFPTLGLGGSYFINDHAAPFGREGDSWQVSAFLRWNVFDGTLRKHESSKARYKEMEAAEYLDGLKKAVSFKVHEAYLGVEEAGKNAELSEAALKSAEEGERLVRLRYENALSPMVDLMDAQLSLDNARAGRLMRKNEYSAALLSLSFESGAILKDLNIE